MTDLPHHDTPEGQLLEAFMHAIWDERHRAHDKHGATSMEQAPLLAHKRASVLTEEAVECAKALNDHDHGEVYLRPGYPATEIKVTVEPDALDKELIQTAAMAYTWWANRRGDRLAPPEQKPIRGGRTQTISVFIDGTPHIGVIDPVTGEVHVHTVVEPWGTALHDAAAGEAVEVRIPPIPPIPVRKSSDLSFHGVSFIRGPSEPSMATGPILTVRDAGCVAAWPDCHEGGYDPRCCRFPKPCSCEEPPESPADASWVTFEDARGRRTDLQGDPVPPADDPDGGRRGD